MPNFTTRQGVLFYCYAIDEKQKAKIDQFLSVLENSGISSIIESAVDEQGLGRPGFNPYAMFAATLYGFAMGSATLRELESSCRNDIRFRYIMNEEVPTYASFSNFINKVITPHVDEVFACIVKAYLRRCNLGVEDCHIDGTKFEAKSNKYKVVWKPTRFHLNLSSKIRGLLKELDLLRGIPNEGIIDSHLIAKKLDEASELLSSAEASTIKVLRARITNLSEYLAKSLEYEEKERICGVKRWIKVYQPRFLKPYQLSLSLSSLRGAHPLDDERSEKDNGCAPRVARIASFFFGFQKSTPSFL